MRNYCAVCSLAVALCLFFCVSATDKVTRVDAERAVEEAKAFIKTVREKAQTQIENAKSVLEKVESSKSAAEAAASKSQETATDNTEAKAIATKIKSLSDEVVDFHSNAIGKLETVVKSLEPLLESAKKLESTSTIAITANAGKDDDFTDTKDKATTLKSKATELDGQIDTAVKPIAEVSAKADEMAEKAKEAQLKDAHVSAIVAVAKIKSMLENADNIIPQIEEKEREVSGIVDEMQKDCTSELTQSNEVIKVQCESANDALKSAQGAVQNAKGSRTAIQTQKVTADAALTKVTAEKQEVSVAQNEASTAEACVTAADKIVTQLDNALQIVTNSVTKANDAKQKLVDALEKATSQKSTEQTKEKEETNLPVADGTDSQNKDATIQPTSKDPPSTSDKNSEKIKQTLINAAQNVPTTALTGGKAPAPGAKNDSAMTVSVPLLVALIASAVLQ